MTSFVFLSEWYFYCFLGRLFAAVVWSRGVSLVQMAQHWTPFDLFVNLERYVVWPSCTILITPATVICIHYFCEAIEI